MPYGLMDLAASLPQTEAPPNIEIKNNAQLAEEEQNAQELEAEQNAEPIQPLVTYFKSIYARNRSYKEAEGIQQQMLDNLRQRNSEYPDDRLAAIRKQGLSEVFVGMTQVKCRAAEAWLFDVLLNDREKSWGLKPTPIPRLPSEVEQLVVESTMGRVFNQVQANGQPVDPDKVFNFAFTMKNEIHDEMTKEAKRRATNMERVMLDQLTEGGWETALDEFFCDLTTSKCAVLKGPIVRRRPQLIWQRAKIGNKRIPIPKWEISLCFERVDPLDIYPSDGATTPDEGDFVERTRWRRRDLAAMRGLPGWNDSAINAALLKYGATGYQENQPYDSDRRQLEVKSSLSTTTPSDLIEGFEFWGSIQGKMLREFGISRDRSGQAIENLTEYEVNSMVAGQYLVYLDFNPDVLGRRPYHKTGWAVIPGSFYYMSIPELMACLQQICNASARGLINNLGIASGPQAVIEDISRLAPGEKITQMYPWKIWQFINNNRSALKALSFFQPKSNAQELMAVFDRFAQLADDFTSIPAYAYGNDRVAGAGRTLGGLSLLMGAAARGIKRVIGRVDLQAIRPLLTRLYEWNMQYLADDSIKGDAQITVQGALDMIVREQMAASRIEFLQTTANPIDSTIMGQTRRANVLREAAAAIQLPADSVVPNEEEMEAREAIQATAQMAQLQQQDAMQATVVEQALAKARADNAKAQATAGGQA